MPRWKAGMKFQPYIDTERYYIGIRKADAETLSDLVATDGEVGIVTLGEYPSYFQAKEVLHNHVKFELNVWRGAAYSLRRHRLHMCDEPTGEGL